MLISYIYKSTDFIEKIKKIGKTPKDEILLTGNVVGFIPNIPHKEGLEALRKELDEVPSSKILSNDLINLSEFVLKNNILVPS